MTGTCCGHHATLKGPSLERSTIMLKQFRILWISLSLLAAFLIAACDSPTGPADPGEPDTPMEQPVPELSLIHI